MLCMDTLKHCFLVLLGVMFFALDWFVVTDREEVKSILSNITTSFRSGNVEKQQYVIDENYHGFLTTKTALIKAAMREGKKDRIESVGVSFQSVKVTGSRAEMQIKTNIRLNTGQIIPMRWTIYWGKSSDGWKITEISTPNIGL